MSDENDTIRILSDQDCPGCGWPECVAVGTGSTGPQQLVCGKRDPCGWSRPVVKPDQKPNMIDKEQA